MRSTDPITDEKLCKIGVSLPGHRARLLAHLEDSTIGNATPRHRLKPAPEPEQVCLA